MQRSTLKPAQKRSLSYGAADADLLWRVAWTYIRTVIATAHEPFLILDGQLRVLSANKTFYRFFHVLKSETEGVLVFKLGDGQWDIPELRKLLEKILPADTHFSGFTVDHVFPEIGRKILLLNARRVYTAQSRRPIILLAMEDITRRAELEENLREYAARLNAAVTERTQQLETRIAELERLNRNIA